MHVDELIRGPACDPASGGQTGLVNDLGAPYNPRVLPRRLDHPRKPHCRCHTWIDSDDTFCRQCPPHRHRRDAVFARSHDAAAPRHFRRCSQLIMRPSRSAAWCGRWPLPVTRSWSWTTDRPTARRMPWPRCRYTCSVTRSTSAKGRAWRRACVAEPGARDRLSSCPSTPTDHTNPAMSPHCSNRFATARPTWSSARDSWTPAALGRFLSSKRLVLQDGDRVQRPLRPVVAD